jgi:hypothetical protein
MMTQYNNPTLDNEYARRLGTLLSTLTGKNETFGDSISEMVNNVRGATPVKQFVMKEIMSKLKSEVGKSLEEDPHYLKEMMEYRMKHASGLGPLGPPIIQHLQSTGAILR